MVEEDDEGMLIWKEMKMMMKKMFQHQEKEH